MSDYPRRMPARPRLFRAEVVSSSRLTPSFQRITITGPELSTFDRQGFDQWFRLFIPRPFDRPLVVPQFEGRGWWQPYLAIPEDVRPHCSNYTVAGFRCGADGAQLDFDVVLHWDAAGRVAGGVAQWATSVRPGAALAILDQGVLFDPPADTTHFLLAADETGLPAIRGILRDLPATATGWAAIEVPDAGDVVPLAAPAGVDITWLPRGPDTEPGALGLAAIRASAPPRTDGYAFVVGESALATGGRRAWRRAGLAKEQILFSGFWKRDEAPAA